MQFDCTVYSYNPMFAAFCCINYIVPFFMWPYDAKDYLNLVMVLRLIAGLLCVGLLLKDIWPKFLKKYLTKEIIQYYCL